MSDRSRKTSNVVHMLTAYFKQTAEPPAADAKLGDIWFDQLARSEKKSGTSLPSIQKLLDKRKEEKANRPPIKSLPSIQKLLDKRKEEEANRPPVKSLPSIQKLLNKRKEEKANRPPIKIPKLVDKQKEEKANRPPIKIPKLKKKRSL